MLFSTLCISAALSVSTALPPAQSTAPSEPTTRVTRSDAIAAAQQAAEARVREVALLEVRKRQAAARQHAQTNFVKAHRVAELLGQFKAGNSVGDIKGNDQAVI